MTQYDTEKNGFDDEADREKLLDDLTQAFRNGCQVFD